jgi:hypothetical protein
MVGSVYRKDISVRTPSLAGTVITAAAKDSAASYIHLSNPNPQNGKSKFKSVRDHGYSTGYISPGATSKAGLTLIHTPQTVNKFGKRVFMGNYQMSDKDVFGLHMQQINYKGTL